MSFPLVKHGKGRRKGEAFPSFFVSERHKQETAFRNLLKMIADRGEEYYTEDETAGWELIEENKSLAKLSTLLKHGTDKLIGLIELAREEELSDKEILSYAMDNMYIEPGTNAMSENVLLSIPIKEVDVDLHGFKGFVNKEIVEDLYERLKDGIGASALNDIEEAFNIVDGTMTFDFPYEYWHAYVDEETFKDAILKRVELEEDVAEERKPAVATINPYLLEVLASFL